jgi:hypothetical protein
MNEGGEVEQPSGASQKVEVTSGRKRAQWTLIGIIVALTVGVAAYRLLHAGGIDETSALFIGLPTVLAIALALTPRAKSATGMIMKGLTIALLLSGPVLREGFICVLMASPLFYLVGGLIGWAVDVNREKRAGGNQTVLTLVIGPLLLMSLEGVTPSASFSTALAVEVTKPVLASPTAVENQLAGPPRFAKPLPWFLGIGFPSPTAAEGSGLRIGDRRTMYYSRGGAPKKLIFEVADRGPGYLRFRAIEDETKIGTWLNWSDAEVRWAARADGGTDVTWTLHFSRRLSPAWYFGPLESFGATQAADYLIDTLATS